MLKTTGSSHAVHRSHALPVDQTPDTPIAFRSMQIAQGDLLLQLIERLPDNLAPLAPFNGHWALMPPSAGRPGGSHTLEATEAVQAFALSGSTLAAFVVVRTAAQVRHAPGMDENHCHAPVVLPAGVWRLIRQREHVPVVLGNSRYYSERPATD